MKSNNDSLDTIYDLTMGKVLNYLSYGLKTEKEIHQRLALYVQKLKISESDKSAISDRILARLNDLNLVNDKKVLENFIINLKGSSKLKNKKYISDRLFKKGFNPDDISDALDRFSSDYEYTCAVYDFKKRYRNTKDTLKVKKYLLGKGYHYDVVDRVLLNQLDLK